MDWYRFNIRARCGGVRQRWYLVDVMEGLSRQGLQEAYLETVQFAGVSAFLDLPLDPELRGAEAHRVAEVIIACLSRQLGAKSYLFVGELEIKALALADEDRVHESQAFFLERGFNVSAIPVE